MKTKKIDLGGPKVQDFLNQILIEEIKKKEEEERKKRKKTPFVKKLWNFIVGTYPPIVKS